MAYFISAKQAREKARKDSVIQSETASIEATILVAVEAGTLSATVNDNTTMTESTSADAAQVLAENYHSVWQGGTTDATKSDQMAQVIKYFVDLGYSIHREINTSSNTTFKWVVSW
jgi:hypothetical protein